MARSMRLRLQLWHAAILTGVIVVFATAFYRQLRHAAMSEIDGELLSGARVLEGTLRALETEPDRLRLAIQSLSLPLSVEHGPPRRDNNLASRDANLRDTSLRDAVPREREPRARNANERNPSERDSSDGPFQTNNFRGRDDNSPPPVADSAEHTLGEGAFGRERRPARPTGFLGPPHRSLYFAIFSEGGQLLREEHDGPPVTWQRPRRPIEFRKVTGRINGEKPDFEPLAGARREILLRGPMGTVIIVGADVSRAERRLTESLLQLIASGAAVLAVGLLGGRWLAGKFIQPIENISRTAEQIDAQTLSERINTSDMDSELQSLGGTLNSMLGRLEAAFDRQSQFTADASHELRTPIAVIISHCELALLRQRSADEYQRTIDVCHSAAGRMQKLVDSLLILARADAGQLSLVKSEVDLREICLDAITLFEPYAKERNIALKFSGQSVICQADASGLNQVVSNLVSNAILYNHDGGQVEISIYQENDVAIMRVQDTGPGIPVDAIPRLFDRFYRVDEARSRQNDQQRRAGSGLGLAICKSIVDAHGGKLTVVSELDRGSCFEVRL